MALHIRSGNGITILDSRCFVCSGELRHQCLFVRFENKKLNGGQQKYDTDGKCMVVFIEK